MNKIRKGDQVVVLSGKDKGRTGQVAQVLANGKLVIDGINVVKKHAKGNPPRPQPGGSVDQTMPLAASKVAIWNGAAKKADRVGIKTLADGKRVRFLKSNNEVLDVK